MPGAKYVLYWSSVYSLALKETLILFEDYKTAFLPFSLLAQIGYNNYWTG